jgi:hypothetical protein
VSDWKLPVVATSPWIGPCVHGRDPFDRCDECDRAGPLKAITARVYQLDAENMRMQDELAAARERIAELERVHASLNENLRKLGHGQWADWNEAIVALTKERDEADEAAIKWRRGREEWMKKCEAAEARERALTEDNARLREALERETMDVSLERTWCRSCRTENRSRERARATHPHAKECPLASRPPSDAAPTKCLDCTGTGRAAKKEGA